MTADQMTMVALIVVILVLFIWGRWRYDLIAFTGLLVAVVVGLVKPAEAFVGFGHPAVVTVAAVLVLSRALGGLSLINRLSNELGARTGDRPAVQMGALGGITAALSAFINNVGALALFMPVALKSARRGNYAPGLVLMPLAFAAILGGLVTLIGTPPNIIIATFRAETTGAAFGMFDFAPVGFPVALLGILFVTLIGWRLIPRARREGGAASEIIDIDDYVTEVRVPEEAELIGKGRVQLESAIEGQDAQLVGLIRADQRIHTATWRGRVRADDILLVEAAPDAINEVVRALGVELVGADREVAKDLRSEDLAIVEAVVSPAGMIEGRTAGAIALRTRYGVNLLAVSRQGRPMRSRLRNFRFQAGDVMLLQGPEEPMAATLSTLGCLPLAARDIQMRGAQRDWLPIGVFVGAIACTSAGLVSAPIALGLAAMAMLFMRVISLREAYDSINWPVIILLGAMIPIGGALETTKTTELITQVILGQGAALSPVIVLTVLLIVTMTLSDIVNNAATAVIMAPIGVGLADRLGVNADPFLMAVAVGASCAFLTPIGHQNNTLVMGPGGYRFSDYWRMGLPLEVLIVAASVPLILLVWPL